MRFSRFYPAWLSFVCFLCALLIGCGRSDPSEFDSLDDFELPDGAANTDTGAEGGPGTDGGDAGSDANPDAAVRLASLQVTPPLATATVGTLVQLTATGVYSDNTTSDLSASATWTSSTPGVASVNNQGLVTSVSSGVTTVSATVNGITGTAKITVTAAKIVSIAVTPKTATTGIGGSVPFKAVATLSDASTQDVTSSVTWSSGTPSIASISSTGLATGVTAGTSTIGALIATSTGTISGSATLTVSAATLVSISLTPTNPVVGTKVTFPFSAIGTYSDASIADLTATATWSSSAPSTVSISAGGVATTLAAGTSIVTASVGNVTGQTTVTVTSATLASISVTPASSTLAIGGSTQLKATGTYSDNSTFDLTGSATWTSSATAVASVSNAVGSAGAVTALAAGTSTISASLGGVKGTATVTVSPATLVSIAIAPAGASVPKSATLQLTAKGTYSDNSVRDITASVSWSTTASTIATISNAPGSQGIATGVALGTTTVSAQLGGITGTTTLTVTAASLVSIAVAPASVSLVAGTKQSLTATGTYSDGTKLDLTTTAVWTTNSANVAAVSNTPGAQGLVTAVFPGTATVTATFGGISGTATVTVTIPAGQQLTISPIQPSVTAGQRIQFQAIEIFTNNTQLNVTVQSKWTSSKPSVATINATGGAQAVSPGTTTITATFNGLTASTTLTVTNAVPVSISVAPIAPTLAPGTVQPFSATAIYSDGTSLDVTPQATWVSSSPKVAAVSTAGGTRGRVTALSTGTAQISATWSGLTGSTTVTVSAAVIVSISVFPASVTLPVGDQRAFTAQAIYSDGTSRDVTGQATWISSAPSIVGVNDANQKGLAKALSPGNATIRAAFGGLLGTASVTVTTATLTSIQVTPFQPSVAKGVPVVFQATAIFSDNTSQNITGQATWTSSSPAVAAVSDVPGSKGFTQTLSPGQATIRASWNGVTGTTILTVTSATLTTIQVTPFAPTIPIGFTTQLAATGIYSDNTTQDLTPLATWISSAPGVASVSDALGSKGRLSPLSAGKATISAVYQGVTGTDVVTVTSAILASISVSPASSTVTVLGSQPFTAIGKLSDATVIDVTAYVTWLSSTPAIASISNAVGSQGVAKGLSVGTVTITAVRGPVSGTASLKVQ